MKRIFSLLLVFGIIFSLLPISFLNNIEIANAEDGSELDPWLIDTCEDLQAIGSDTGDYTGWQPDDFYTLNDDIDCSDTIIWNDDGEVIGEAVGTGDNAETIFNFNRVNIVADSQAIYLDSVEQTVIDDYTIDLETGVVTFVSPIGGGVVVTADYNYYQGFIPIGYGDTFEFAGTLNGNDNTVTGLYISADTNVGLISRIDEIGIVKNIGLVDVDVSGNGNNVGGLVGQNEYGTIQNSYVTGSVEDVDLNGSNFGLLVGDNKGIVENSYSEGSVVGNEFVGGLLGFSGCGAQVSDSYSTADVTGVVQVGGLTGYDACEGPGSTYDNVYATGSVTGTENVGGLIGGAYITVLDNSYATGNIDGTENVGGLIGRLWGYNDQYYSVVTNSYATGNVEGSLSNVGGFVGYFEVDVESTASYIDASYATGNVISESSFVGGFVGALSQYTNIYNSYSRGNVTGASDIVGGFVGMNYGDIYYSYSTGTVEGNGWGVGGFAGTNGNDSIYSAYSTGTVVNNAEDDTGGFIGNNGNDHVYENSGWWIGSGPANAIGENGAGPVEEIEYNEASVSAFKDIEHGVYTTLIDKDGILYDHWDFEDIWGMNGNINNGYPFLLWGDYEIEASELYASPEDVGDGDCLSVENSCDLQQALDLAEEASGNVTINLSEGEFEDFTEFDDSGFTDSITIVGAGIESTYILSENEIALFINSGGNVEVSDITFDGNNNNGYGLYIGDSITGFNIHDNVFENNILQGLHIESTLATGDGIISNNTFSNNINDTFNINSDGGGLFINISGDEAFPITILNNTFSNNQPYNNYSGGGMYLNIENDNSLVMLNGNTFENNDVTGEDQNGGGAYIYTSGEDSDIIVGNGLEEDGNTFNNNTSDSSGGGLYAKTIGVDSAISLEWNTFTNNSAGDGGGFYLDTDGAGDVGVVVADNTIGVLDGGNTSTSDSGGGRIYAKQGIVFNNNEVIDNHANQYVGGIQIIIDDFEGSNESNNTIQYNNISNNYAENSAGGISISMDAENSNLNFSSNTILNNTANLSEGGGVFLHVYDAYNNVIVTNNVIANNTAMTEAGGMDYYSENTYGIHFVNNTVVNNEVLGGDGGGLVLGINSEETSFNLYNNIIWENEATESGDDLYMELFNSNHDRNVYSNNITETCILEGDFLNCAYLEGNYDYDPQFTNSDDYDYTLRSISELINLGENEPPLIPDFDITGESDRIYDGDVDLGAYEFIGVEVDGEIYISNCEELMALNLNDNQEEYYDYAIYLENDIDCTGYEIAPLFNSQSFQGVFDGNNYSIINLDINLDDSSYGGLFDRINGGTIRDLVLDGGEIYFENEIDTDTMGALAGQAEDALIENVCSSVEVDGSNIDGNVGGLIGYTNDTIIRNSCSIGNVYGVQGVGGLIGGSDNGLTIENSYYKGEIEGVVYVGGLVGYSEANEGDLIIIDSYVNADVGGDESCGGIIGGGVVGDISQVYFSNSVNCDGERIDGLIGFVDDVVNFTDSFWTSSNGNSIETLGTMLGATDYKTDEQLQDIETYTTNEDLITPWDFDEVWDIDEDINDGFPYLRGLHDMRPVITEIEDIPDNVNIGDAVYRFSLSRTCEYLSEAPTSDTGEVELLISQAISGEEMTARLSGIQKGGTYSFGFYCRNNAGNSEGVSIGPYTINMNSSSGGGGGSSLNKNTIPVNINPNPVANETNNQEPKFIFTKNLRLNITDNEVKELQKYLNNHNFSVSLTGFGSKGNETNYFGNKTKQAVQAFQLTNSLVGDGIVGPVTRGVLNR